MRVPFAFNLGVSIGIPIGVATIVFFQVFGPVGGRAPSPSPSVSLAGDAHVTDSGAAPARSPAATTEAVSVAGGNGEDVVPVEEAELAARSLRTSQPEPASTVTQSALTREGGPPVGDPPPERWIPPPSVPSRPTAVTSSVGGGALTSSAPATPVSTSASLVTKGGESNNSLSKELRAGLYQGSYEPWPAYLWPTVACIVQRESGGDPHGPDGSQGERGLMQVHPVTWAYLAGFGITPDQLYDGPTNIRAGWLLYLWNAEHNGDGLRPWGGGCA